MKTTDTSLHPLRRAGTTSLSVALLMYAAGILLIEWIDVAVLCRGSTRHDGGCGPFELPAIIHGLAFFPVLLVGLFAAEATTASERRGLLYYLASGVTLCADVIFHVFELGSLVSLIVAAGIVAAVIAAAGPWIAPKPLPTR